MAIVFYETKQDDGSICITWSCDTPLEFRSVIEAIKHEIDYKLRKYDPLTKRWIIQKEALEAYERIKHAAESNGIVDDYKQCVENRAIVNMLHDNIALSPSMLEKAAYAINAANGIIEADIQFCYTLATFGAYNPDAQEWWYTNGSFSSQSPQEKDSIVLAKVGEILLSIKDVMNHILCSLDNGELVERSKFRAMMLGRYNNACYICKKTPRRIANLHMHRVVPGRVGGQYIESNVVILCRTCHKRNEGKSWDEINNAAAIGVPTAPA